MSFLQAIILAIVEGITEFLPISSTGHMALVAAFMNIPKDQQAFTALFIENIQFGAIISVLLIYWRKFIDFKSYTFYIKLFIAFLPSAIVGLLIKSYIDKILGMPEFIAGVMLGGGVLLIFVDNWFRKATLSKDSDITYKKSLIIGLFQLLAILLPGFSRSAATIIGGMQQKLTRKLAAEFSFFLAVPTLAGAFVKSTWDAWKFDSEITRQMTHYVVRDGKVVRDCIADIPRLLTHDNILLLVLGNAVAFVIAIIAIKAFIAFLTKHGFKIFGYYRIIVGVIIILLLIFGKGLTIL
jgi:undecaprenyl-diphosphatase